MTYSLANINTAFAALGTKLDSGLGPRVDFIHGNLAPAPNNITVPSNVGVVEATAITALGTAGLAAGTRTTSSGGGAPYIGKVYIQSPAGGTTNVQAGSRVNNTIGV